MDQFLEKLYLQAAEVNLGGKVRVLFPETDDKRILEALPIILEKKLCLPVLIGNRAALRMKIEQMGLELDLDNLEIIDLEDANLRSKFASELFQLRKEKGLSFEQAELLVKDLHYFSVMVLKMNLVDGLVAGSASPTGKILKPILQIIKTKKDHPLASSAFVMLVKDKLLIFSDSALNVDPSSEELAEIALNAADLAKSFNLQPKIALLSFSSHGSTALPLAEKVANAAKIAQEKAPDLLIDGEIQVDAALVPEIALMKTPDSSLRGEANVLIFPNLETGNIAYKLLERLAETKAIGAILLGLNQPANDLSRGCSVEDIVNLTAITVIQAGQQVLIDSNTKNN